MEQTTPSKDDSCTAGHEIPCPLC